MRVSNWVLFALLVSSSSAFSQEVLDGTWKLISSKRTDSKTGTTIDTLGSNPQGYIMYGKDGRMMVIETRGDRARPVNETKIDPQEQSRLFGSMLAYAGIQV